MRFVRSGLLLCFSFLTVPGWGQQAGPPQTPAQAAQAAALMQQSLAAQISTTHINDITLNGNVTVHRGAVTESGTIILTALATGQAKGILTLPSGIRTSFKNYSVTPRVGTSVGPDGTSTNTPPQELLAPSPAWFFPALIMASELSSSSGYAAADMGEETQAGAMVRHLAIWSTLGGTTTTPTQALQQLGQQDLYLDPTTLLPLVLTFNLVGTNPNRNVTPFRKFTAYTPQEVHFLQYQQVNGLPMAFHIQVYIHNTLAMDIQVSSISLNTGATISAN